MFLDLVQAKLQGYFQLVANDAYHFYVLKLINVNENSICQLNDEIIENWYSLNVDETLLFSTIW